MQRVGNKVLLLLFSFSLLLVGCTAKKGAVESRIMDMESMELVTSSPSVVSPRTCLSGNLKMSVNVDGTPFSAKGTMRIKEGCGVQIGMTALGLIEIACLEFLPENMRLIYKVGKEYADVRYADVAFLQKTGIDYGMLESVLMNKLFSPDGRPFLQAMRDMSYSNEGNCVVATTPETNGIVYRFYIDRTTCELVQSEGMHADGGKVTCRYSDFRTLDGATFPHAISMNLEGVGDAVSLQFILDRVDTGDFNFSPRRVTSYGKMNVEQMLKSLGNL